MSWPYKLARRLVLGLALLTLVAAVLALVIERGGWLERWVRDELVARLGEPILIEDVRLSWLDAALEIDGLSLGLATDKVELQQVRIVLRGGRGGWPRPVLIEVQGGRIVLGEELERRIAAHAVADDSAAGPHAPAIVVRDLQIDLRHPTFGVLPIGSVHAAFASDAHGRRSLVGRLKPGLAPAGVDDRRGPAPLYLAGDEFAPGEFAVQLSADGSPFSLEHLPTGTPLDALRATGLKGRLALDGELRVSLARLTRISGHLRARLTGGSLAPTPESAALANLTVDVDARCAPGPGEDAAALGAWRAVAHASGTWRSAQIEAWTVLGTHAGENLALRGWVLARDLPVDAETRAALHLGPGAEPTWNALAPRGACTALTAIEVPLAGRPRFLLEVECSGRTGITYVGWPAKRGGIPQGFPMPVEQVYGRLVALFDFDRTPAMHLAIFGARGSHMLDEPAERTVWLRGQVLSQLDRAVVPEWDMRFGGRRIPVDGGGIPMGLAGLKGTEWIWPAFQPQGGEAGFEAAMQKTRDQPHLASRFQIEASGVGVVWEGLPMPVQRADLGLELRFDPRLSWGVAFRGAGRGVTSDRVGIAGRLWSAPHGAQEPSGGPEILFEDLEIQIDNVALRGTDRQILGQEIPEVEFALEQIAAAGKVDVRLRRTRHALDAPAGLLAEVTPREVVLSPQAFRIQTRNVRGRVLIAAGARKDQVASGAVEHSVRLAPLVGDWPGGAVVACMAELEAGRGELRFQAAGLEPLNRGLVGALQAVVGGTGSSIAGPDLSALSVDGRVDAEGSVQIGIGEPAGEGNRFAVFLRDNDFRIAPPSGAEEHSGFGLTHLNGVLIQVGQELGGSGIRAQLGRTPLVLREARFSLDESGYRLETRPSARGLPLDREHLRFFLDPGAVDALVDELDFGGSLDIDDARLVLSGSPGGTGRVSFEGEVRPRDLQVHLGLPVEVESAAMRIESLVFEGGHVRAWATVEDLAGKIADRRLQGGRLQLTYVEPHLSILDLDGELEGGRLAHLGGSETAGGPAFSMDLAAPFPFDLGLALRDVEVEGLLRGLFESEFASTGLLSGELRLTGNLEKVRTIHGDGSLNLRDTTLWSIPVMRALFSQLGFDNTAVFERMRTRFQVRNGAIHMSAIQVYSPLLQLVGSGSLDFEGRLRHDLEVRYSLVDNLGPLRRILYWVQNNLLRIAVRGDMSRPRVEIEGVLSFLTRPGSGRRDLPLPALTPLPARF
jgi:hypothetical protein